MDNKFKSREVFGDDGRPIEEDPEVRAGHLRELSKERFPDRRLEVVLDRVDFDALRNIYGNHLRTFGIDPSQMNFLGPEAVDHLAFVSAGAYSVSLNTIGLSYDSITEIFRGLDSSLAILRIYIHENTHAISKTICSDSGDASDLSESPLRRTEERAGFHYTVKEEKQKQGRKEYYWRAEVFLAFNEAVTDKFARQIFKEYLDRCQSFASRRDMQKFFDYEIDPENSHLLYNEEIVLLDALIQRLSREAGVSEEIIWGSILQSFLRGENWFDDEFKSLFADIFGDGFVDELASYYGEGTRPDLIKRINSDQNRKKPLKVVSFFAERIKAKLR